MIQTLLTMHNAAYLCNDSMQHADEYKVECGWRLCIEAELEKVVVVRRDAETRQEAVDHEVNVLTITVLTAILGRVLGRTEQQSLIG